MEKNGMKWNAFRPHLGGVNEMKWKWMKKIILEYSFIPLFGSFNGMNKSPFICLRV